MPFFCYECNTHVDAEANAENGFVCSTCGGDFVEETEEAPPPPPAPAFVPMMIPGLPHGPPGGPQNNTAQIQAAQARLQELQAMMQNLVQQMGGAGGGGGGGGGGGPAFMPFFGGGGGGGGGGLFGNHGDYVNEASYQNILNNLLAQESRKRGAPPASPAFLKNLANQAAEEAFPETFAEEACPICQAEYERGDVVNVMAPHCDHAFHRDCIHHWLRMHNTCPVCRTELPTEGYDPSDSESPVEGRLTVRTHPHTLQHCALTSGWFCDGCRVRGFGHRYRCTDGCDFDFCSSCLDSMVVSVPTGEQGEATATSAVDAAPATATTTASPASTNRNDGGHGDGDGDIDGEFYDSD